MMTRSSYLLLLPWVATAFRNPVGSDPQYFRKSQLSAIKESTFGMGCFWEPSEELLNVKGVVGTIAGYTGNPSAMKAPSYDTVCFGREWVEGVRVTYDDSKISYAELLEAFFQIQKPKLGSRQYASIIFAHDKEQEKAANEWRRKNSKVRDDGFLAEWTEIEPQTKFFQAEGYHQNYWQKQRPRFALIIALLAVSTGALDDVVPEVYVESVKTFANGSAVAIGLFQLLERVLDAKVVEI